MMAGGTAANILGTMQRDKAQRRAMKDYQGAVNQRSAQEQAALGEGGRVLSGFARERQGGIGQYLNEIQASQSPDDQGNAAFAGAQRGILSDIGRQTGGAQSSYAYQGAPRSEAEGQQGGITQGANQRMAEAMLADHQLRSVQERQTNAAHKMSLADLLRQGRGKSTAERMQLAKALRDLDWQKKTAAMQGQLDEAGRKGQWANILGGLATQTGGMAMMAGMGDGGAGGTMAPAGAAAQGPLANSGFANMSFDPDLMNPMGN